MSIEYRQKLAKDRRIATQKFLECYPEIVRVKLSGINSLNSENDIKKLIQTYNLHFPEVSFGKEVADPKEIIVGKVNCQSTAMLLGYLAQLLGLPHCWYACHNFIGNGDEQQHWSIGIPTISGTKITENDAKETYDRQRVTEQSLTLTHLPVPIIWIHWISKKLIEPIGKREIDEKRIITNPHGSKCTFFQRSPESIATMLITSSPLPPSDYLKKFEFTELATVS